MTEILPEKNPGKIEIKPKGVNLENTNVSVKKILESGFLDIDFSLDDDLDKFVYKIDELLNFLKSFSLRNRDDLKKLSKLIKKIHIYLSAKK